MGTTTMGQAPDVGKTRTQTAGESAARAMRQVWWATLGLAAVAGQGSGRVFSELVRRGKEVEPSVGEGFEKAGKGVSDAVGSMGTHFKGFGEKFGKASGKMESFVDERVSATLQRMGVASRADVESLSEKVDELGDKIEELRGKLGTRKRRTKAAK